MIVNLTCSYSTEFRQIVCLTSFSIDWLREKLSTIFGLNSTLIKFTLEGVIAEKGVISDYVRGKQQTAYVEIFINIDCLQPIKCFVKYGQFLRVVNGAPQSTLYSTVSKAFSDSLLSECTDLSPTCQLKVDGKEVNNMSIVKDCLKFGSVIEVVALQSIPMEMKSEPEPDTKRVIDIIVSDTYHHDYVVYTNCISNVYVDLIQHCTSYLDITSSFLHLYNSDGIEFTPESIHEYVFNTERPTILVKVEMRIKDSLSKIHCYTPCLTDTVASLITDIQNCPFIHLPMKLTKNGEFCEQNIPVWNLLNDINDTTAFRATERTEDIDCYLLIEDYNVTIDTKVFGMKSVSIPEGALLCVEKIQSREGIALVEYNGYHNIEVPLELCCEIPEDEEIEYETPVIKKACVELDNNCPFQLPTQVNHQYVLTKENSDYYYGHEEGNEEKEGWILKSILV